ncbi:DNA-binding transcriptional response regulator, NtrC family, contains REC, AAA-type ATPase, and a Fis-type DNA-binding domains [Tindallia magadiensis]|uniref:Stage 0 sporulation protein A homolog n=1 Tax=Tindallia magadiensis TaxID=69895 RepID=A0A1I3EXP9_9FIRM|nr:sigma-54 dependent transcriptional regulator [Tindallia magadiensis]SFI03769.1 DNA-binding transcriptional response regulator, NtrC family, contains REC, AAA-type ATPase, and a Fis-type DNA-binding domains [Tindallia magadiensis]
MKNEAFQILVVDDEQAYSDSLSIILRSEGYAVDTETSSVKALEKIGNKEYHLVISDFMMEDMDGFELLKMIKEKKKELEVIIVTGYGSIKNAVEAMKKGAFSYYIKSHDPTELLHEVSKVKRIRALTEEIQQASESSRYLMRSKNKKMQEIIEMAEKVAQSDTNVLLLGESGVGKEVIANYIHEQSNRKSYQFIPVNCRSYSKTLLESELFGHEKGAYTGATETRIGKVESAQGGTLFLDEIGDATLDTQIKLLRVLDAKYIERIGSNEHIDVDFRLICATNQGLKEQIQQGEFREDFFYRISTFTLEIPALRERQEDIEEMVRFFVKQISRKMDKQALDIEPELMAYLLKYSYPGNIRELKNIIERLIVLSSDGILRKKDLLANQQHSHSLEYTLKEVRAQAEKAYIEQMLRHMDGHLSETANRLGITRRQLFNKIGQLNIHVEK